MGLSDLQKSHSNRFMILLCLKTHIGTESESVHVVCSLPTLSSLGKLYGNHIFFSHKLVQTEIDVIWAPWSGALFWAHKSRICHPWRSPHSTYVYQGHSAWSFWTQSLYQIEWNRSYEFTCTLYEEISMKFRELCPEICLPFLALWKKWIKEESWCSFWASRKSIKKMTTWDMPFSSHSLLVIFYSRNC